MEEGVRSFNPIQLERTKRESLQVNLHIQENEPPYTVVISTAPLSSLARKRIECFIIFIIKDYNNLTTDYRIVLRIIRGPKYC